jgi:hypothetical protein
MPPRPNEISPGLADFLNNFSEFFLARILREKDLTTDETSEQISDYFDRLDLKKTSHIRSEYFSLVLFLVEYSRHLISKNDELNPLYFKIIAHLFGIGNALAEATPK